MENRRAQPGILAVLNQLQYGQKVEELTDGGVAVSAMRAALAKLPRPHKLVATGDVSAARSMEEALEVQAHAHDYMPRSVVAVGTRLERLEQRFHEELVPKNQVHSLMRVLQSHRERLQDKFAEWDFNGDGEITKAELASVMGSLGLEVRQWEIDDFFDEFDDGSGALDLKEFYFVAFSGGLRRFSNVSHSLAGRHANFKGYPNDEQHE